ncbi:prephenate dehydrogenase/arogenate dehydrogenase family protein [Halomicroarcula limicola]|uniref:Prephenate dehydrogenase/arogenate dehydrogenase family protein n=1 Tax=Haloarcula limicola TaxID=1429915 RepID=A0A8J8C1V9_9EURY|nr:prephenate dehydrogenase/arogenate dehydrogenase family protein [Halomicroarcula limicola]MBV0922856.1 prephenate dehydrogenase/arogenate dehydrogenase family protein [Halomicroarcula limicola]
MNVLVVGAGSMGEWFARTMRDHTDATLAFTDTDSDAARRAAEAVGGRAVPTDTDGPFDVICIAVPMPVAEVAIEEYAPRATEAIVDVTGSMAAPLSAMAAAAPETQRASLHPLFAPENAPGNVAVVTDAGGDAVDVVVGALAAAGNDTFETTPEEHDEAMETVQAGAHAAVLAYALAAADVPERFHTPVSAGMADLVEQVTGGDAHVYADIQETFEGADRVAEAARRLADADRDGFAELYETLS